MAGGATSAGAVILLQATNIPLENNRAQHADKALSIHSVDPVKMESALSACWARWAYLFVACGKITAPQMSAPPGHPRLFLFCSAEGDGEARFRWAPNNELDFKSYLIYRSVSMPGMFVRIGGDRGKSVCKHRFLSYDSTYYYYITAIDYAGNESQSSGVLDVKPVNISSPPPTACGISLWAQQPEPQINHLDSADHQRYELFPHLSQRHLQADEATLVDSTVSIFSDVEVSPGALYFYKVACVDLGGRASAPSQADMTAFWTRSLWITPSNRTVQPQALTLHLRRSPMRLAMRYS